MRKVGGCRSSVLKCSMSTITTIPSFCFRFSSSALKSPFGWLKCEFTIFAEKSMDWTCLFVCLFLLFFNSYNHRTGFHKIENINIGSLWFPGKSYPKFQMATLIASSISSCLWPPIRQSLIEVKDLFAHVVFHFRSHPFLEMIFRSFWEKSHLFLCLIGLVFI